MFKAQLVPAQHATEADLGWKIVNSGGVELASSTTTMPICQIQGPPHLFGKCHH